MIKTRWHCKECDEVCEKRPFFNVYLPGFKNARPDSDITRPGAEWLCTTCKHKPQLHTFTFKEPKE